MLALFHSSPLAGRWQPAGLTEGAFGLTPFHAAHPLHHRFAAVPLPATGEDLGCPIPFMSPTP